MVVGSVSTTQSLTGPMHLLPESTWATGVVVAAATTTLLAAGTMTGMIGTVTGTVVTAIRTRVAIAKTETATTMAGTTGTGATAAALLLGRATHRSTEGVGAIREALLVAAALLAVATTMRPLPVLRPPTAMATLAGEATAVR